MNDLKKAQKSGLHDYEIVEIKVDYDKAHVIMNFKSPKGENYQFNIEKFLTFTISHAEAWGKGKYVCSSDIQLFNNDVFVLEIELNSGDQIIVKYVDE